MNALYLFRDGMDTGAIARLLNIDEAQAYNELHRQRCKALARPCETVKPYLASIGSSEWWRRRIEPNLRKDYWNKDLQT